MNISEELLKIIPKENIFNKESMKKHTSFKIGGEAETFIIIENLQQLKDVLSFSKSNNIQITVIGNGTNILVKDGGIKGITIKINLKQIEKNEDTYIVGSGVPLTFLSKTALEDELTGLEFACGIPGTIGGAIKMNAGAYGGEIKDIVLETTYIDYSGKLYTINNNEHKFEYRKSIFNEINAIIIQTKIKLQKGNKNQIQEKMNENFNSRKEKQPIEMPSAGSTFKRGNNFITAKVIDELGLKGYKIGGAEVSNKHAGFIVNSGDATAKDVINLIEYVKKQAKEKLNLEIEEEIQIIGEDN